MTDTIPVTEPIDQEPVSPAGTVIRLTVNGLSRQVLLDPRTTLPDALRSHLGLTGSKKGCDHATGTRVRELPIRLENLIPTSTTAVAAPTVGSGNGST